jgi:hypothetical protein
MSDIRGISGSMKSAPRHTRDVAASVLFGMAFSWPAFADMGPAVLVPAVGGLIWNLLLGIAIAVPRRMFGRRCVALAVYSASVVAAWIVNLQLPVDSYLDTMLIFVVPVLALMGLYAYAKVIDAIRSQ